MTRYTGITENKTVENLEGDWSIAYGFDTGGLTGETSYFIQAWLLDEEGLPIDMAPTWSDQGGKEAIIESPFWDDILENQPSHAEKIVLDLPF